MVRSQSHLKSNDTVVLNGLAQHLPGNDWHWRWKPTFSGCGTRIAWIRITAKQNHKYLIFVHSSTDRVYTEVCGDSLLKSEGQASTGSAIV